MLKQQLFSLNAIISAYKLCRGKLQNREHILMWDIIPNYFQNLKLYIIDTIYFPVGLSLNIPVGLSKHKHWLNTYRLLPIINHQYVFVLNLWSKLHDCPQLVLLHLHEIVEGLYFHCSLSVCVCVCLSVCLCVQFSCEQNSSRTDAPI